MLEFSAGFLEPNHDKNEAADPASVESSGDFI